MNDIGKGKQLLQKGGVVVYPTDTLYGLGVSIFKENAVRRVHEIKRRPYDMPLPVIVSTIDDIKNVAIVTNLASELAGIFLPGALTLILEKKNDIPHIVATKTIAVRVPDNQVAQELASKEPITATSANIHGGEEPITIEIAKKQLGDNVDVYIDGGVLPGKPSTIVDATREKMSIIREGVIKKEKLYDFL